MVPTGSSFSNFGRPPLEGGMRYILPVNPPGMTTVVPNVASEPPCAWQIAARASTRASLRREMKDSVARGDWGREFIAETRRTRRKRGEETIVLYRRDAVTSESAMKNSAPDAGRVLFLVFREHAENLDCSGFVASAFIYYSAARCGYT